MHALFAWLALGILVAIPFPIKADDDNIELLLEQKSDKDWLVRYKLSKPVKQLRLHRPPHDAKSSRTQTWRPINPEMEIVFEDGLDLVRQKDGGHFDDAEFFLTAPSTGWSSWRLVGMVL